MGLVTSSLYTSAGQIKEYFPYCSRSVRQCKVIISGLDAAGKTSILYTLKEQRHSSSKKNHDNQIVTVIPTIGFNVETLKLDDGSFEFTAWDTGGRDKMRPLFRHYYDGMEAIVFVVDSNDTDRLEAARDEFHRMLQEEKLQDIPALVYCNKQDLPRALSPEQIAGYFGIEDGKLCRGHVIIVQGCSVLKNVGLATGLERLAEVLENDEDMQGNHAEQQQQQQDGDDDFLSVSNATPSKVENNKSWLQQKENLTLQRFAVIKNSTECPFAKAAKLRGGKGEAMDCGMSLEDQAKCHTEALIEFANRSNAGENLDGFCIDIDHDLARTGGPEEFGECVRRMLTALAEMDPSGENMMRVGYIGMRGWRFRFNRTDFFVTTFAPCYPETSSRYTFGCDRAFVLLQPELSFLRHNLPPDTEQTNWNTNDPNQTIRDKTRAAFRDAQRAYHIPNTTTYPMAEHIVKPLNDDGESVVRWWVARN